VCVCVSANSAIPGATIGKVAHTNTNGANCVCVSANCAIPGATIGEVAHTNTDGANCVCVCVYFELREQEAMITKN
jgi:hypothetical protein